MLDPIEERCGQRPESGTNLDDMIVPARIDGGDDPADDLPIDEKVLAESLARCVPEGLHRG